MQLFPIYTIISPTIVVGLEISLPMGLKNFFRLSDVREMLISKQYPHMNLKKKSIYCYKKSYMVTKPEGPFGPLETCEV